MKKSMITILASGLMGCASVVPPQVPTVTLSAFNPDEVNWFQSKGTASIYGQAFFQTRGGQPRTCAGTEIGLLPHSAYANERLKFIYGNSDNGYAPADADAGRVQFSPDDHRYRKTIKTSVCDAQGNFIFSGLPQGEYFVIAKIVWSIPGREFLAPEGGALMQRITLTDGEQKRVILSR